MFKVDLNSDLGESFGRYTIGMDSEVIPLVSSVNVACGFHAGDPVVMHKTVETALAAGVAIGAHPGYPDLQGFGRRDLALSPSEAYAYVQYQVAALDGVVRAQGGVLHHVKPHGQMYNRAAVDKPFAEAIAQAVVDLNPEWVLVGLAGGCLIEAGKALGLRTASEFFVDRNYTDEGTLQPRSQPNASIADEDFAVARVVHVIQEGNIQSVNDKTIQIKADTLCVHGDSSQALAFAQKVRKGLKAAGIEICAV